MNYEVTIKVLLPARKIRQLPGILPQASFSE